MLIIIQNWFATFFSQRLGSTCENMIDTLSVRCLIYIYVIYSIVTEWQWFLTVSMFIKVDIVPTLSLLLGSPIPYSNLGRIIPELFLIEKINNLDNTSGIMNSTKTNNSGSSFDLPNVFEFADLSMLHHVSYVNTLQVISSTLILTFLALFVL